MNADVKVNDAEINRKIAQWAILCNKDMAQATRDVATRFTKAAVRNTPPMIAKSSPAQVKRAWLDRLEANYEKRYYKGKWLSKAEMRQVIKAKTKQLGRMAAGWNAAARELKASVPAWVKRHSAGEGGMSVQKGADSYSITVSNRVPYGTPLLRRRAEYALASVKRGLDGSLRALKRKLIRSMR